VVRKKKKKKPQQNLSPLPQAIAYGQTKKEKGGKVEGR